MYKGKFSKVAITKEHRNWHNCVERIDQIYSRKDDIRSDFFRDYSRILHCEPFRRLKRKTQVFFTPANDHLCTRIEHVNHVCAVSYTISKYLGLNTELTTAIALGHDIGHAPFGHEGERRIMKLSSEYLKESFWHEKNGIHVVDDLATLQGPDGSHNNLSLTYAVRDGIISHCGEVDEESIRPREKYIDLYSINKPNEYPPYTWEACVVKIADKISYLGRDIEDAIDAKILYKKHFIELKSIIKRSMPSLYVINNTVLMHDLIISLVKNSSPQNGLCLSNNHLTLINEIKEFNYNYIYKNQIINYYANYVCLIIETIFDFLYKIINERDIHYAITSKRNQFPLVLNIYFDFLIKFSDIDLKLKARTRNRNRIVYSVNNNKDLVRSVIDFISGMTDNFAIKCYNEIISF